MDKEDKRSFSGRWEGATLQKVEKRSKGRARSLGRQEGVGSWEHARDLVEKGVMPQLEHKGRRRVQRQVGV